MHLSHLQKNFAKRRDRTGMSYLLGPPATQSAIDAAQSRLGVVLPEQVEMRELFRLAAEHEVQIRRMNYRRDSLEDIFLNAMQSAKPLGGAVDGGT